MKPDLFHPAVAAWFEQTYGAATPAQARAWPVIKQGRHTLISAPTGSGKTLAAFLSAIDDLVREGIEHGLKDEVYVLYVSPLKALSNDINKNLEEPLSGITQILDLKFKEEVFSLDAGIRQHDKGGSGNLVVPGHIESPDDVVGKGNYNSRHTGERQYPVEQFLPGMERSDIPGKPVIEIRSAVRTGDTTQTERNRMRQTPPHILVTTPESLFILLTSDSGRRMLSTVRTVIVDEIHALADNKRGSHLALSLERLEALTEHHPTRIGLSATQKPLTDIAHYLVGKRDEPCEIVDVGYTRKRDLAIELPDVSLGPLMPEEGWRSIYDRLAQIAEENTTTLVFVNTRRLAERAARHMAERLGEENVTAHHGSLAREHRLNSEQRLKKGELKMLIATSSLELGIDIGDVSCVCQLGSPRSIAALLQRVGRSGHQVGGTPKGRLFPLSRDDLVECVALLDAIQRGELDKIEAADAHLDVLCQQIIAEVGGREWNEDELYEHLTRAWPYRNLSKEKFTECLVMLAEGFTTKRGRRSRYIFRDAVNQQLKPRPGAKLTAVTNGGAIPDQFDYNVVLEPQGLFIGTLNEDFAFESLPGDIVQLGNTSYRILKVEQGKVRVEDARGQPPTMPFWFGEAPGRTDELSASVSRLRADINERLKDGIEATVTWLVNELNGEQNKEELNRLDAGVRQHDEEVSGNIVATSHLNESPDYDVAKEGSYNSCHLNENQNNNVITEGNYSSRHTGERQYPVKQNLPAGQSSRRTIEPHVAQQLVEYLAATKNALGTIPTQHDIVFERFFDEAGDQHLVIHSPYGSRVNRAWGLALRKRFCRQFNFELQAAALEDTIVLSLGPTHSFPLDEVTHYLNSKSVRDILIQAICAAPVFMTRWRWVASIALALRRNNAGRRIPAQFQRMDAEDLMAVVFPDQLACAENLTGEREVPEHPLVEQTLHDCLHEVMDIDGLIRLLQKMEQDDVTVHCRDLNGPSPLAQEILFARPYAFLDDAPAEERRTQAVNARRFMDPADAADLAGLDPEAIKKVAAEAWPDMNTPDELHDALMVLGFVTEEEFYSRHSREDGHREKDPSTALGMTVGLEAGKDAVMSEPFGSAQSGLRESNSSVILSERSESKDLENDSSFPGRRISPSPLGGEGRIEGSLLNTLESDAEESDTDSPNASSPSTSYWRTPVSSRLINSLIAERRATVLHTKQKTIITCAERLPLVQSVFQNATMHPTIDAAGPAATRSWPTDEALVELLRARLEGSGIISESRLAELFECTPHQLQAALMALENEGYAMRGNFSGQKGPVEKGSDPLCGSDPFSTGSGEQEWCERGLLARIHRYTIKSLRNAIQAVSAADYMRFLFDWHGMTDRPEGDAAVLSAIDKLEGFPLPAGVWETDILPVRIKGYLTTSLDHLCSAGHVVWARLNAKPKSKEDPARASKAGLLRNTPITLLDRYNVDYWRALQPQQDGNDLNLHANAATVLGVLKQHGASFFVDIVRHSGLLRTHAEEALAELAALGVVTSDSFAGLRALITPANKKPGFDRMRRRRPAIAAARGIDDAGRWSIIANTSPARDENPAQGWIETDWDTLNHVAYTLLKRYGVVFHRVLERESGLPPWRELLYAWRRMEARGEIRGGRFVEGFSGEQFAMPEAVTLLRKHRNNEQKLPPIVISATDPLNLVGIVLPGERIPAIHTNRILFQDGLPVAKQLNGEIHYFGFMSPHAQWEINFLLTRKKNPAGFVQGTSSYSN